MSRIPKQEAELKSAFGEELKRRLPRFLSLQLLDAGAPDRGIVGNRHVTFLEFKHATPLFKSPGIQELYCMRLEKAGFCRYVIWHEGPSDPRRTLIVRPSVIYGLRSGANLVSEESFPGFDHVSVVEWLKKQHGL